MNMLRSYPMTKLNFIVLLILVTACSGNDTAWTLVELLSKGDQVQTATVTVDVRNCGVVERKTHDCSAGTTNDLSVSLGGSIGAINASVDDSLGIGRNSGQSLNLDSPPEGFIYRYTVNEEYRVATGNVRARSSTGQEQVASYTFHASCSLRIESRETLACQGGKLPIQSPPTQPPPVQQPIAKGKLLYDDTFDSSSGWYVEEGMKIENGNLIVYPGNDAVPSDSVTYADFVLESQLYIPESGTMAFYLRNQIPTCKDGSWNCSIQIVLDFKNPNQIFVARRSLGNRPPLDITRNSVVVLHLNDWNKFVAEVKGNSYKVYINGSLVLDFIDNEYTSGSFIVDNDPYSNSEIKLDYIRIYKIQ